MKVTDDIEVLGGDLRVIKLNIFLEFVLTKHK